VGLAQPTADLVEPGDGGPGPLLVGGRAVRAAAPQREGLLGLTQCAGRISGREQVGGGGRHLGEARRVDLVGADGQPVAAGFADQDQGRLAGSPVRLEHPPQPEDVRVERGHRPRDAAVTPHGLAQRIGANGIVGVDQQQRQRRLQPGTAHRPGLPGPLDLQRSQVAETQACVRRHRPPSARG
jgi:hypothetical protein